MSARLHLRRDRYDGEGLDIAFGLCGIQTVHVTEDPGLVRCKLCRARMDAASAPSSTPTIDAPFAPGPARPVAELGGTSTVDPRIERIAARAYSVLTGREDAPRWRTLDAALAMWRRVRADESPIRSGWKAEQESRSEGAVRTTHGRDEFIEVDRLFALAFAEDVVIRSGTHILRLTRAEACEVLRSVSAEERDATDWAELLMARDRYATRELVGQAIQRGRAAMRAALEAKGLVEKRARRVSERTEGDAMAAPMGFDLDGWKEILPLLGMTEATARERMMREDDPLPITPWCGRVIAVKSEIAAWLGREAQREREARRRSA